MSTISMDDFIIAASTFERAFEAFERDPHGKIFLDEKGTFREVTVHYLSKGVHAKYLKDLCGSYERPIKKIEELLLKNEKKKGAIFGDMGVCKMPDEESLVFTAAVLKLKDIEEGIQSSSKTKELFDALWASKKTYKSMGRELAKTMSKEELKTILQKEGLTKASKILKKIYNR